MRAGRPSRSGSRPGLRAALDDAQAVLAILDGEDLRFSHQVRALRGRAG
jgi:hypothetical protein